MTISAAIVMKATKNYIIHNSYEVETKYLLASTEKCKVMGPD